MIRVQIGESMKKADACVSLRCNSNSIKVGGHFWGVDE